MYEIDVTSQPIDGDRMWQRARDRRCGAIVVFLGTVREFTGQRQTRSLGYEAHREMALHQLQRLAEQAGRRWEIVRLVIEHRIGQLELGEIAVGIAVSTPHRADAFAAAQWLMETIKQDVPIWKQEQYEDGSQEWVHPTSGGGEAGT